MKLKVVALLSLVVTVSGPATTAFAFKGQEYARQAKLTLPQARAVALKAVPGTVTDEELEKEPGGSGLRYSFDIKVDGVTHEVGVDAKTGKILENSIQGPHSD